MLPRELFTDPSSRFCLVDQNVWNVVLGKYLGHSLVVKGVEDDALLVIKDGERKKYRASAAQWVYGAGYCSFIYERALGNYVLYSRRAKIPSDRIIHIFLDDQHHWYVEIPRRQPNILYHGDTMVFWGRCHITGYSLSRKKKIWHKYTGKCIVNVELDDRFLTVHMSPGINTYAITVHTVAPDDFQCSVGREFFIDGKHV